MSQENLLSRYECDDNCCIITLPGRIDYTNVYDIENEMNIMLEK